LGTIIKRLENKYYWSVDECFQDIHLLFSNCHAYYKNGDDEYFAVCRLSTYLITVMREMCKIEEVKLDSSNCVVRDLHEQYSEGNFVPL